MNEEERRRYDKSWNDPPMFTTEQMSQVPSSKPMHKRYPTAPLAPEVSGARRQSFGQSMPYYGQQQQQPVMGMAMGMPVQSQQQQQHPAPGAWGQQPQSQSFPVYGQQPVTPVTAPPAYQPPPPPQQQQQQPYGQSFSPPAAPIHQQQIPAGNWNQQQQHSAPQSVHQPVSFGQQAILHQPPAYGQQSGPMPGHYQQQQQPPPPAYGSSYGYN